MLAFHHANIENLNEVFLKYASVFSNGEHYMTPSDFVVRFLQLADGENINQQFIHCIARTANSRNDGLISFDEFRTFETLLCTPDALYALAFKIFDRDGCGYVPFDRFKEIIQLTRPYESIPLNFDCDFIRLHFGDDLTRPVSYEDFTQIVHDINDEHAVQAFKSLDQSHTGTISASDFNKVMTLLKSHLLSPFVRKHLSTLALEGEKHGRISFAYYMGFINLLSNMDIVKKIFRICAHFHQNTELTKEQFLTEAQHFSQITPMEINILFQLASHLHPDGRLCYRDLSVIAPVRDDAMTYHSYASLIQEAIQSKIEPVRERTVFLTCLEQIYRFSLGAIAGAFGATTVYPIDLVKTRMQNQRTGAVIGELLYKNSWDCFRKVIRFEGFSGLYRGLLPQLVGVSPEKAIKLTVNDLMRDQFASSLGCVPFYAELLAGGCAGASQVVFTNPLEIVKIRLQVAGEIASTRRISAACVIKELGLFGLYKGSSACFLRDIPFSAIYFTAYSHLKKHFADEEGQNSPLSLLAAATLSGAPAACLSTPADVVKTRLQVVARQGQTKYSGISDAVSKIWREEGGRAFWKGAGARVCRSSPQFGVTLLTYEMLQRLFNIDFGGSSLRKPKEHNLHAEHPHSISTLPVTNPDHIGGFRFATAAFNGIETKLGLCFPKHNVS